ncbi:universal stress protein UspE [compost metagenome]
MKKILFPTDFSNASLNSFIYALRLAKKIDAEIITVHVLDLPLQLVIDNSDFLIENYNISEWGDFENFKSKVPKLRDIAEKHLLQRIKVTHMLERGNITEEILNIAHNEKPDFIVMGTTGATGLKEVFLGSVAEKIINKSRCRVLAIPEGCQYKPIRKILFLALYEKYELDLLGQIEEIAGLFNAHINVLQIKKNHEEEDNIRISQWKDHFEKADMTFSILATDAIEETVLDYIELNKIDVAAVTVHQKGFFEKLFLFSLSRQLAYHSTVPILTIPT